MYNACTIVRMQPVYTFIINDADLRRNIDRVTVNKDVKMSMYMKLQLFHGIARYAIYR